LVLIEANSKEQEQDGCSGKRFVAKFLFAVKSSFGFKGDLRGGIVGFEPSLLLEF
jgi:hypothetical protein